jgi:tetratricopeptide (TPR) repeat protein
MRLDELIAEMEKVPPQDSPMFPFSVRELAAKFGSDALDGCQDLLDMSDAQVAALGASEPGAARFLALYLLLLINWRGLNFRRYRELVDHYDGEFNEDDYPYFLTFRAQYYSSRGDDDEDLALALECARTARGRLPRGPAVLNLYASTVAKILELNGELSEGDVGEAERAIADAIRIDRELVALGKKERRFAGYHATRARLQTLLGRHSEARRELHRALDLEDPADTGRLAEYLAVRGQIALNQRLSTVSSDLEALSLRIEEEAAGLKDLSARVGDQLRVQAVQLLGLLAAVLAFLFTGTEIARELDFRDGSKLMLVVSGAILVVFGAFSLIFYAERLTLRRTMAALLVVALGAGTLTTGFLV